MKKFSCVKINFNPNGFKLTSLFYKMVELILGLDEAGKGPVLGPMILCGCLVEKKDENQLRHLGVKDSKTVTSKRREFLEKEIKKIISNSITIICEPKEIDESNAKGIKLTEFEADKFAKIINKLNSGKERMKVVIDCPSIGINSWTDLIKPKIKDLSNLELVIEHKADKDHIAVSAASILAKCERERRMNKLKEKYGDEIGSGYSSDPLTIKFVQKYANKSKYVELFRKSWATWKNASKNLKQIELDF